MSGFFSRRPDTVSCESSPSYYGKRAARLAATKEADHRSSPKDCKQYDRPTCKRQHSGGIGDDNASSNASGHTSNNNGGMAGGSRRTTSMDSAMTDFASHSTRAFTDTFYEVVDVMGDVLPLENSSKPKTSAPREAYKAAVAARNAPPPQRLYANPYH